MRTAQGPQRRVQEPRAIDVRPGSRFGAQVSSVPVAVEQVSAETDAGQRDVHVQQRVAGHLHQRRAVVSREFTPGKPPRLSNALVIPMDVKTITGLAGPSLSVFFFVLFCFFETFPRAQHLREQRCRSDRESM